MAEKQLNYENLLKIGLTFAKKNNFSHLTNFYKKQLRSLRKPEQIVVRKKPLICFVVDHKGWCGERLSLSIIKRLKKFDGKIVRLGDHEHLDFDADMYLYRNIFWFNSVLLPNYILNKTIALIESERVFQPQYTSWISKIVGIVPLNNKLRQLVKKYKPKHLYKVLPNGVETDEFYPIEHFPSKKFVVGTAGNFSLDYYDDWKGFSKYIVPACKLAKLPLMWCSWLGRSSTGEKSVQYRLDEMSDFYHKLSCFVLMSKSEACSGVTFEALSSGIPVVSTKVGWHGETCKNEILWIKRPKNETESNIKKTIRELADKILYIRNHPNISIKMSLKGREFAEKYSWDKLIHSWEEMFEFYFDKIK